MSMKVAVLGLGIMGAGMARQLLEKGFDVAVWNRSPERALALGDAGARVAARPAEAAEGAACVVSMLSDDDASRNAWEGADGALAAMAPGAIAIECSTLTLQRVRELDAATQAVGVGFLDAPVTGSRAQAESGQLRFLIGGRNETVAAARPVLEAMGIELIHLGGVGSGALLKLANNYLAGVQVASLAEALTLLTRAGTDVERAFEVLGNGAPGSPIVKLVGRRMLDQAYDPNFFVPLMAKDLGYAGAAMESCAISSGLAEAARQRFLDAARTGFSEKDIAAVIEPIMDRSKPSAPIADET